MIIRLVISFLANLGVPSCKDMILSFRFMNWLGGTFHVCKVFRPHSSGWAELVVMTAVATSAV